MCYKRKTLKKKNYFYPIQSSQSILDKTSGSERHFFGRKGDAKRVILFLAKTPYQRITATPLLKNQWQPPCDPRSFLVFSVPGNEMCTPVERILNFNLSLGKNSRPSAVLCAVAIAPYDILYAIYRVEGGPYIYINILYVYIFYVHVYPCINLYTKSVA